MHVKLLFPNLGKDAGEEVELDDDEAVLWCERGLAEPVEADDLGRVYAERALVVVAVEAPPLSEAERAAIPTLRPIIPDA